MKPLINPLLTADLVAYWKPMSMYEWITSLCNCIITKYKGLTPNSGDFSQPADPKIVHINGL